MKTSDPAETHLRIRNLEKYQHYRDRNPPWVKLHRDLLENYEFEQLPDATKAHALLLLLLAARIGNVIPIDPLWIGRKIGARSPIDLSQLLKAGFLEVSGADCKRVASDLLAERVQVAMPEGEGEGEGEAEERETPSPSAPRVTTSVTGDAPVNTSTTVNHRELTNQAEQEFIQLWEVCERRDNKAGALKAYLKARKSGKMPDLATVKEAYCRLAESWDWTKEDRQYHPMMSTWLNREGWNERPRGGGPPQSALKMIFPVKPNRTPEEEARMSEGAEIAED